MQQTHPNQYRKRIVTLIRKRRVRRGFSLFEIIVAVAIIAMISAGTAVAIGKVKAKSDITAMTSNAEAIRTAIKTWWLDHDGCPTVGTLLQDGVMDKGKFTRKDRWDQPWVIKCEDGDATVISRGPDKLPDTEDDIRVPNG